MEINNLFLNNLYSSKGWAIFMNDLIGNISNLEIDGFDIPYDKKTRKVIAIHNYSSEIVKKIRDRGLKLRVIEENNSSNLNYQVIPKQDYEIAKSKYSKSFRKSLNNSLKYDLKIVKNPDFDSLYSLYVKNIFRLGSFAFSKSSFYLFLSQSFCKTFGVMYDNKLIAGKVCWEYKDNFYSSLSFSDSDFWFTKPNNFLWDFLVKYACENSKNIHLGIGIDNSGYEKFKEGMGAIKLKCVSYPQEVSIAFVPVLNKLHLSKLYGLFSIMFSPDFD